MRRRGREEREREASWETWKKNAAATENIKKSIRQRNPCSTPDQMILVGPTNTNKYTIVRRVMSKVYFLSKGSS